MKPEHDPEGKNTSRRPSLTASFAKAARRRLSTVLLGAALISGCATTINGQSPASAAPMPAQDTVVNTQGIAPPPPAAQMTPEDSLRRAEIRLILLRDAQTRYPELRDLAETPYSQELKTLQDSLNAYLTRADTTMHNAIVVLDPSKIDVAVSIGVPLRAAIAAEVARHANGGRLPDETLGSASANAATPFQSEAGVPTYTQNPSAYPNMTEPTARPCLIIPASDYAHHYDVPGFTKAQKIEFTNTHEGWHCLDNRYRMTEAQMKALDEGNPRNMRALVQNADLRAAASVIHHKEALADIAALGDMIRHGHDIGLIDHAVAWRQDAVSQDYLHYSAPGLKLLKTRIEGMGIDAFRAMAPAAVREMYFEINEAEALTPPRLKAMAEYLLADRETRPVLRAAATEGSDAARGIAHADEILKPGMPQQALRDLIAAFTPPDTLLRQQLLEWKPLDRLEKGAIEKDGKITPETLIRSYGAMQNDLHKELSGEDPRLAREKMALLKGIFTRYLRGVDYVAANEKYGVDIEVAERELIARGRASVNSVALPPRPGVWPDQVGPQAPQRTADAEQIKPKIQFKDGCGCPQTGYKAPR